MVPDGFMHKIKKHISFGKMLWLFKNRVFVFFYQIFLLFGHVNDMSIKSNLDKGLIRNFRLSREEAIKNIKNAAKIFSWALHEADGRNNEFQDFDKTAWDRWLGWYRFHHFNWNKPKENKKAVVEMGKSICRLGRKTWSNLFKRYIIPIYDRHDLYSLPDVYYITSVLGHLPSAVIDVGGGWGRLGMAWTAIGVKTVGITDSIEQPYIMQNQYLKSVPGVNFKETLESSSLNSLAGFSEYKGIMHFPLWHIGNIHNGDVEVISAIQVLREINSDCLEFLLFEIRRVLRYGGLFYIRDNDPEYKEGCMHDVDISGRLLEMGFKLVFKPDLIHGKDIHGLPRIFQKL